MHCQQRDVFRRYKLIPPGKRKKKQENNYQYYIVGCITIKIFVDKSNLIAAGQALDLEWYLAFG